MRRLVYGGQGKMNPDSPVGYVFANADEALRYYERVAEAEKAMGPLSRAEKMAILRTMGREVTLDELKELMAGKKTLIIRGKNDERFD